MFGKHVADQSPESDRAACIHGEGGAIQIGYSLVQRQPPSTQRATNETFRLGWPMPQRRPSAWRKMVDPNRLAAEHNEFVSHF